MTLSLSDLTPRQREIAPLYASGLRVKVIAQRLGISAGTVDNHLDAIHDKIGPDPERTRRERIRAWWGQHAA